jgi:hypothetical protein
MPTTSSLRSKGRWGRKVSDRFTVPICRLHHRELHRRGNERVWWENHGIDPLPFAASLWGTTHAGVSAEAEIVGGTDRSARTNTQLNGHHFDNEVVRRGILGAGSQDDARLLRRLPDRSGLCVGARKSF